MKLLTIFCISILLYSCSSNREITGKYSSTNSPYAFQFNKDSTFTYGYLEFHSYEYSTGWWRKINRNHILLNSIIQYTIIPLEIQKLNSNDEKQPDFLSVEINIKGMNLADYRCLIFINDSLDLVKRCDSISKIKLKKPINSLFFKFIQEPVKITTDLFSYNPLITEKLYPEKIDLYNSKIRIAFNDSLFAYKIFNDELIKVKNNKVKIFNSYKNKWEAIPKVPDSTDIIVGYRRLI